MPTNADREHDGTSVQHRRAHTGLHAGFGALAIFTLVAFAGCDSKGSGAPTTGAGGKTGSGGSNGSGLGGMMSMGNMGGMTTTGMGGMSGMSGSGGAPAPQVMEMGMTTAKLCNLLIGANMESVEFTLEIGSGPVTLIAASGKCSPPGPAACAPIPAGNIHLKLTAKGTILDEGILSAPVGVPVIAIATLDSTTGRPTLVFPEVPAGDTCESIDVPPPDGGSPPRAPDAGGKR
jgi:hypothetical protein